MSDFMKWLYDNYILPQLKKVDMEGYEMNISLMDTTLDPDQKIQYKRVIEFIAVNAFVLGLRTGAGMKSYL